MGDDGGGNRCEHNPFESGLAHAPQNRAIIEEEVAKEEAKSARKRKQNSARSAIVLLQRRPHVPSPRDRRRPSFCRS